MGIIISMTEPNEDNLENDENLENLENQIDPDAEEKLKKEKEFKDLIFANLSGFKFLKNHKIWVMTKLDLKEKGLKEIHEKIIDFKGVDDIDLSGNEFEDITHIDLMSALR